MKDFHLPLHSRSVFSRSEVVPARKNTRNIGANFPEKLPEKILETSFQTSCRFSEALFSRRAMSFLH